MYFQCSYTHLYSIMTGTNRVATSRLMQNIASSIFYNPIHPCEVGFVSYRCNIKSISLTTIALFFHSSCLNDFSY